MSDTHGLPLNMSIVESQKIGVTPSIPSYVCDAVLAGWNPEKAIDSAIQGVRESDLFLGIIIPDDGYEEMRMLLEIAARQPTRWCTKTLADKHNTQITQSKLE